MAFLRVASLIVRHRPTPQEFNIEKLQVVEAEKQKIRKEYERKEGQVDVKKKMCDPAPFPLTV